MTFIRKHPRGGRSLTDDLEIVAEYDAGEVNWAYAADAMREAAHRIRELEAAQCKHHIAATLQLPCMACGRDWRSHSVPERKSEAPK